MAKVKGSLPKDYYSEYEKLRDKYFEEIKAEYLHAIDIAVKKIVAHNVFEQRKMKPESMRLQKELGVLAGLMNTIRHEMELDKRIKESELFSRKITEIESSKQTNIIKLLAEYEGLNLMYQFWQHYERYVSIIVKAGQTDHLRPEQIDH